MNRKNVLLIIVDQLIAKILKSYGGNVLKTPNLDKLASEGTIFTSAFTPTSLCSPARASIFTGKLPHNHGMLYNCTEAYYGRPDIDDSHKFLAEILREHGYECGYIGKWHIGTKKGPCECGFEGTRFPGYGLPNQFVKDYDEYLKERGHPGMESIEVRDIFGAVDIDRLNLPVDKSLKKLNLNIRDGELYYGVIDTKPEFTPSGYVANKTIDLLNKYKGKPFFITAAFWAPHHPAFPNPDFKDIHNPLDIVPWENFNDDLTGKPRIQKRYRDFFHRRLTGAGWDIWQKIIKYHYDFMSMIDYQIGLILDELTHLGLDKNTVVIFTSDHGDTLGCHGGQFDKGPYMYEETYQVPLIVRVPDITRGERNDALVMNMDIFSTVLDICGVSYEEKVDFKILAIN